MGRNNHNVGMHFMRYSLRVADADAVAYISRKEAKLDRLTQEKNTQIQSSMISRAAFILRI